MFNKKSSKSSHYEILVECTNCKNTGVLLAPKGVMRDEAVNDDVCNRCGCQKLKIISETEYYKRNPPVKGGLFG